MSYLGHDDEMPRGFQDADFEMRGLEASARRSGNARKRGICDHGWTGPVVQGQPERQCYHCHRQFPNESAMDADRFIAMESI